MKNESMAFEFWSGLRCDLGESPVWDDRRHTLWCVDIDGSAVCKVDWSSGAYTRYPLPKVVGSMGVCENGQLILALRDEVVLFEPAMQRITPLGKPQGEPDTNRLNDGKVGPDGAFWVGSMDERKEKAAIGSLYRVTPDGVMTRIFTGCKVSNGLAWTPDGRTLFHSDSRGPWLDACDFDPATGAVSRRRRIANLSAEQGRPDGAACDELGRYWSSGVSAGVLNCIEADGRIAKTVKLPLPCANTMPVFAGPSLDEVVVTTARHLVPEAQRAEAPEAGRLLRGRLPGVHGWLRGAPVHRFAL